jgi:hypothetical protein
VRLPLEASELPTAVAPKNLIGAYVDIVRHDLGAEPSFRRPHSNFLLTSNTKSPTLSLLTDFGA